MSANHCPDMHSLADWVQQPSSERSSQITDHLAQCDDCRFVVANALRSAREHVAAKATCEPAVAVRRVPAWRRRALAAACMLAVAIGGVVTLNVWNQTRTVVDAGQPKDGDQQEPPTPRPDQSAAEWTRAQVVKMTQGGFCGADDNQVIVFERAQKERIIEAIPYALHRSVEEEIFENGRLRYEVKAVLAARRMIDSFTPKEIEDACTRFGGIWRIDPKDISAKFNWRAVKAERERKRAEDAARKAKESDEKKTPSPTSKPVDSQKP